MTQQINLYQPILRREKKVFSAVTMLQVLAAIAIVMILLFGAARWQLQKQLSERARLEAQEQELAARVAEVTRDMKTRPESRELRRQLEASKREAMLKQRLIDLMQDGSGDNATGGFSEAFAGLARQRITGLWLTGVELHREGDTRQVTLRGLTARADLVPQLVQQLGQEPAFQGLRFRHMRVFRPEDEKRDSLAFVLSTVTPQDASK